MKENVFSICSLSDMYVCMHVCMYKLLTSKSFRINSHGPTTYVGTKTAAVNCVAHPTYNMYTFFPFSGCYVKHICTHTYMYANPMY
jgi:hypothetical protein